MNPDTHKTGSTVIVYDADLIEQPTPALFDEQFWERSGRVTGTAQGRGSAVFVDASFGPAVIRKYLRGGWVARFSTDRYLFTGFERSRPVAEFRLLADLCALGLPVPAPVAAVTLRSGLQYQGSLITREIPDVSTLADCLLEGRSDSKHWLETGACVRLFHDHGVIHADLNARNILISTSAQAYLIDFDRAKIRTGADHAFSANLKRLRRSLEKLWPQVDNLNLDTCWSSLMSAYSSGQRTS